MDQNNCMPVVYVAGPYRAKTVQGIELNIQSARRVGIEAARRGWSPIIPHANTGHMDQVAPELPDEFWLEATLETMRRCDAVVLCPGWARSTGTLGEIEEAKRLGLPIYECVEALPLASDFEFRRYLAGHGVNLAPQVVTAGSNA